MTEAELIGAVAVEYLRGQVDENSTGGTARFLIDCLNAAQTAAIARAIMEDTLLSHKVDLKLPAAFLSDQNLPTSVLTAERATYFRNAACDKPALILANVGDDEQQSLQELVPIGASQLLAQQVLWVRCASRGISIPPDAIRWWEKALQGLQELSIASLDRFAAYVLQTRHAIVVEGYPLVKALGVALPALRIPRDTNWFEAIPEATLGHASRWKARFTGAHKQRAGYLVKLTPSQLLLSEAVLTTSFERVRDSIPESLQPTVQQFIQAPSGWNVAAQHIAICEWEDVAPLFDGFRRERFNLGQATLDFYAEQEPELLSASHANYLQRLVNRRTTSPEDEDIEFYEAHRLEIKTDRRLKSAWDRFLFGTPKENFDFLVGLVLALEPLFDRVDGPCISRRLTVRCDSRAKKDLRDLNVEAGLYFARRYCGLRELFGSRVFWEVGDLFNFDSLVEEWKQARKPLNRSTARLALQLKFIVELEVSLQHGGMETHAVQFIWRFNPNSVLSQSVEDWERLENHALISCRAQRDTTSLRGAAQSVDLHNVKTFVPVYDRDRGSFIPTYHKRNDLSLRWRENLREALGHGFINEPLYEELSARFDGFFTLYSNAIKGWKKHGLAHPEIEAQAIAYADLVHHICANAPGDRNRSLLLRPLMEIGVVAIEGGGPTAVVAPWQPLRLAAIVRKARWVAGLLRHLLTAEQVTFGDSRLFFLDVQAALRHPFYPEIVLGWGESRPELLALTDAMGDYSLHEAPMSGIAGQEDTNENPTEAAQRVIDLVHRYLNLHPHEQANLAIVLYNCDSARLPQAVVEKLGALHADEENIRCQVILRHRDARRLRGLYERLLESADTNVDSYNASEATRDFMARLRIGIMADQAPVPDPKDGCPTDIVFSQDVIARHARLTWYQENARPVTGSDLLPSRWGRRRPAAKDDLKSVVYLCCPAQTEEGWRYLTAVATFFQGDWDKHEDKRLLPARQLDFEEPTVRRIFTETHNLGNWVANFDELLDRRQLLNQNVRVIRYQHTTTPGRNLILSSKASVGLLRAMLLHRLQDLNLGLDNQSCEDLADRFIQDANTISGDIVLRAAKRGRHASELIGLVLSRYLVHRKLDDDSPCGWYFLDDYAEWLGQREQQIADIIALQPKRDPEGQLQLSIFITEAKYIEASSLAEKSRESQKQLRDTLQRVEAALFGNPERLDRELWLARLSDLVLDGIAVSASSEWRLSDLRRAIREGDCALSLFGYSHVFVSGPSDAPECDSTAEVAGVSNAIQEVYGRARLRELILQYQSGRIVEESSDNGATLATYRLPTPRVIVVASTISVANPGENQEQEAVLLIPPVSPSVDLTPKVETEESENSERSRWVYPALEAVISEASQEKTDGIAAQAWLDNVEHRLRSALQQFQLQAKLQSKILTPNTALFRFAGSTHLTVEQVLKRRSELLTTHGLNVIAVQPEAGAIVLVVERPERERVSLTTLWQRWYPDIVNGNQELLVGVQEENGNLLMLSPGLRHSPHTLIAGSTGSGKSVLMQNLLLGIAATNTPKQARITLIDPKLGVDYFPFETLPHLDGGIIDAPSIALSRLEGLVIEMDARYARFRQARASNLAAYNANVAQFERLPVLWLIHDEFAEWMMVETYKQDVTRLVGRLGVKARAAGIYLIFASQRPDAHVMPLQLRANLGNRLILRVDSEGTSEIALGERGAERLLGRGHLLAKLEGNAVAMFAQVPFATPEVVEQLVAACI